MSASRNNSMLLCSRHLAEWPDSLVCGKHEGEQGRCTAATGPRGGCEHSRQGKNVPSFQCRCIPLLSSNAGILKWKWTKNASFWLLGPFAVGTPFNICLFASLSHPLPLRGRRFAFPTAECIMASFLEVALVAYDCGIRISSQSVVLVPTSLHIAEWPDPFVCGKHEWRQGCSTAAAGPRRGCEHCRQGKNIPPFNACARLCCPAILGL